MSKPSLTQQLLSGLLVAMLAFYPAPARADLFGADVPPLLTLASNSFAELAKLQEAINTARATYNSTRELAGYAKEAHDAFNAFRAGPVRFFSATFSEAMGQAYPELGEIRALAGTPWAADNQGRMGQQFQVCLSSQLRGQGCKLVAETMSMQQARMAISAAFGTVPKDDVQGQVIEKQAATAAAHNSTQMASNSFNRLRLQQLRRQCTGDGTASPNLAACQAAAALASIESADQQMAISDQLAQANELAATDLALQNAQRLQEAREARQRDAILGHAAKEFAPRPTVIEGPGFDLLGGTR